MQIASDIKFRPQRAAAVGRNFRGQKEIPPRRAGKSLIILFFDPRPTPDNLSHDVADNENDRISHEGGHIFGHLDGKRDREHKALNKGFNNADTEKSCDNPEEAVKQIVIAFLPKNTADKADEDIAENPSGRKHTRCEKAHQHTAEAANDCGEWPKKDRIHSESDVAKVKRDVGNEWDFADHRQGNIESNANGSPCDFSCVHRNNFLSFRMY